MNSMLGADSQHRHLHGTLAFMAPEAAELGRVSGAGSADLDWGKCDIFSFGVVCVEVLTQQEPPIHNRVAPLHKAAVAPDLAALKALAAECLREEPAGRPASFEAVARALQAQVNEQEERQRRLCSLDHLDQLLATHDDKLYRVLSKGDMVSWREHGCVLSRCAYSKYTAAQHIQNERLLSRFISTTGDRQWALHYAHKLHHASGIAFPIVEISVEKLRRLKAKALNWRDVSDAEGGGGWRTKHFSVDAFEVTVEACIPGEAITNVWRITERKRAETARLFLDKVKEPTQGYEKWTKQFQRHFPSSDKKERLFQELQVSCASDTVKDQLHKAWALLDRSKKGTADAAAAEHAPRELKVGQDEPSCVWIGAECCDVPLLAHKFGLIVALGGPHVLHLHDGRSKQPPCKCLSFPLAHPLSLPLVSAITDAILLQAGDDDDDDDDDVPLSAVAAHRNSLVHGNGLAVSVVAAAVLLRKCDVSPQDAVASVLAAKTRGLGRHDEAELRTQVAELVALRGKGRPELGKWKEVTRELTGMHDRMAAANQAGSAGAEEGKRRREEVDVSGGSSARTE
eukprot:701768-Rhodomonas_salina.1